MASATYTSADVQCVLAVSDEGVRDLVRRGLLHPERVGVRRPLSVYDASEVDSLAGLRSSRERDRHAMR